MNLWKTMMAGAAMSAGSLAMAQMDMSSLPPAPEEMQSRIADANLSLAEAIEKAEEVTGGVAAGAVMSFEGDAPTVTVTVYTRKARHEVILSAASGEVISRQAVPRFPGWELPDDATMQKTDSGLMYFVIEKGDGKTPADASATVEVNYAGFLVDGTKFDSSFDRGETIEFPLNRVIPGWTEGVGMMQEGGKWKLVIPSDLGYGARGAGGRIPPNAMLVFDVELVSVVSGGVEPDGE